MLISIVAVIIVVGAMIFSHELGHFIMAKRMGVKVEIFSLGFGPKLWSLKKGETEYVLSLIPVGGYVKMAGEEPSEARTGAEWEFYSKPVYKRFNIIVSGAAVNYLLGAALFCLAFAASPSLSSRIGGLKEGYPAQKAGLRQNDRIISVNGWRTRHWFDVLRALAIEGDDVIAIEIERDGRILKFDIRARTEQMEGAGGKQVERKIIGIFPSEDMVRYNAAGGISAGIHETLFVTRFTFAAIGKMLTGKLSLQSVSGPIGIFAITGQAAKVGLIPLLRVTALISVSLAIFNLLPFPPLDGGHILFLGIEKIKGGPIDIKVQEAVQQVGMFLLIALLLVVSWNDIIHFFK